VCVRVLAFTQVQQASDVGVGGGWEVTSGAFSPNLKKNIAMG
jgi:glycine cleavage system aminomethyltransferase T